MQVLKRKGKEEEKKLKAHSFQPLNDQYKNWREDVTYHDEIEVGFDLNERL
jgi:hypothetical protein